MVLAVKNLLANTGRYKRHGFNPWVGKIPWRRAWQPTPVFLPGESHGQRSLGPQRVRDDGSDLVHMPRHFRLSKFLWGSLFLKQFIKPI